MRELKKTMCPLYPDLTCPQGDKAGKACEVRVNGDFDPVLYFRDQLVVHCAINQQAEKPVIHSEK